MEATKWLKPSISVSRIGDSASVQAVTRVNAEQSSKRTMRGPTRQRFRGRPIRLGEAERRARPSDAVFEFRMREVLPSAESSQCDALCFAGVISVSRTKLIEPLLLPFGFPALHPREHDPPHPRGPSARILHGLRPLLVQALLRLAEPMGFRLTFECCRKS